MQCHHSKTNSTKTNGTSNKHDAQANPNAIDTLLDQRNNILNTIHNTRT